MRTGEKWKAIILSNQEVCSARLSLDELLRMRGIDPTLPYTQEDRGNGTHRYRQVVQHAVDEEQAV